MFFINKSTWVAGVVARVESLRGRISAFEPCTLATISDALLPKLLSGDGEGVVL
jgi:hypothetical protein